MDDQPNIVASDGIISAFTLSTIRSQVSEIEIEVGKTPTFSGPVTIWSVPLAKRIDDQQTDQEFQSGGFYLIDGKISKLRNLIHPDS